MERIPRVGPLTIARLIRAFGRPEAAMQADFAKIVRLAGLSEKMARSIAEFKVPTDEVLEDMATLERLGARVITRWDTDYPANLQQIYDPPPMLFVRGDFRPEDDRAVAVVGSRNATVYGLEMAESITRDLIRAGITVVSGLARGVDTAAHRTAVKNGGRTIGVLGCGLDIDYPRENRSLVTEMLSSGAVISEFRPRIAPLATNFYRRNRIVSGLTKGVVVIEASRTSGSLITAAHALDQNRDVLAVPGNVLNSRSKGPHHLIKQGAALVESGEDVVRVLFESSAAPVQQSIFARPEQASDQLSAASKTVLDALDPDPVPIDSLCETLTMDAGQLSGILLELELEGLVRQHPGKMFSRVLDV